MATRQLTYVVVLGAGADVPFGVPTVPKLARELAEFCRGEGKPIDRVLRKKLPHIRLNFDKVGGDAADGLVTRLFEDPTDLRPRLKALRVSLRKIAGGEPVAEVLGLLDQMAEHNEVSPDLAARLKAPDNKEEGDAGDRVLDPQRLVLTPVVRNAIRTTFPNVLMQPDLDPVQRRLAEEILASVSNVEELLSLHFARFLLESAHAERRTFLYIAWSLWAFMQVRSTGADASRPSIYPALAGLGASVVTFNYTDFFPKSLSKHVSFFHGRLDRFLRADTREVIPITPIPRTVAAVAEFIEKLRLDVAQQGNHLDLPSIVPPLSFKPVMSRDQLRIWSGVDKLLDGAHAVLIAGYSFAQADEHFNDLLRKTSDETTITVINRNKENAWPRACRALGIDPGSGKQKRVGGREAIRAGRLTCVGGSAETFSQKDLRVLLSQ